MITGQLSIAPGDLSDPSQLTYSVRGTYQITLGAKSDYSYTITEGANLNGSGNEKTSVQGSATAHDPPQPGDDRYQQEIGNGLTADQIAQETGTLTVGFDDNGNSYYALGLQPAANLTPAYTYDSSAKGVFATLSGNCARTFDNDSATLTQTGACGAVEVTLGKVTVELAVPADIFGGGTVDPTTGLLQINSNTTSTTCTISDVLPSVAGEGSSGGTTNTDPLYINDAPQKCSETTNLQLQLTVPPFSPPHT